MISYFEASLTRLSIHHSGNKLTGDAPALSETPFSHDDEVLTDLLMQYFLRPFEKNNETYQFTHPAGDLNLNTVFHFAQMIFNDDSSFHESSVQITNHLHDISAHPRIKPGEMYFAYFTNLQIDGELLDAIGIFKSETKEPYLTVSREEKDFQLNYEQEAISIKKLDKGCLIFNSTKEEGYKIAIVDQTNKNLEAAYWVDDFLKLKVRNDEYNQTHTTLHVYKNFVTKKIDEEYDVSRADKIDMLNRSMKYFKEKENFDLDEFSTEVIGDKKGINLFKQYKQDYEQEFDIPIGDSFSISNAAVKKQARVYKSVLKLDRNFHIYIHGDRELIEQGVDQDGRKYYKLYFENES
jgi:hypothetical protein